MSFNIIIPCFNSAKTLARTLDSLIVQKDELSSIILIDDGSTDNTANIAKSYIAKFPGLIEYHYQENKGPAAARNNGIKYAQGEFTLFLDADDTLTSHALAMFSKSFQENPRTDILIAGYVAVRGTKRKERLPQSYPSHRQLMRALLFGKFSLCGGASALRTKLFNHCHYPQTIRHGEDIVFFSHLLAKFESQTLPFVALEVHHHPNSLRNQTDSFLKEGDKIIDLLFDEMFFMPELMEWKNEYHAKRLIVLARAAIKSNHKALARDYFHQAIKLYPRCLFHLKNIKLWLSVYW